MTSSLVDGRRLRRRENRDAVVEALVGFFDAGEYEPGIAAVAEAAGLSARSVFRYFDDLDDLARAAIEHQQRRLAPHWEHRIDTSLPVADRIEAFVAHRIQLLEAMGHVGRVARLRALTQPRIAEEVARVRSRLRAQISEVFVGELASLPAPEAEAVLAAADAICSFESHDLMRVAHHQDAATTHRAMVAALAGLFDRTGSGSLQ